MNDDELHFRHAAIVRCNFYVREPRENGQFRYTSMQIQSYDWDGYLTTVHPPLVGDLISLWDQNGEKGGMFRVLERQWMHAGYGSVTWPYASSYPHAGPLLDIIVEAAEGAFKNEAPLTPEEEAAMFGEEEDETEEVEKGV